MVTSRGMRVVEQATWSSGMVEVADIAKWLSKELGIRDDLVVRYVIAPASYGRWSSFLTRRYLHMNLNYHNRKWFDEWYRHPDSLLSLLIDQFSKNEDKGVVDQFNDTCRIGASLAMVVLLKGSRIPHFGKIRSHFRHL